MKEILFLLSRSEDYSLTRNHIVHAIEIEKWVENTKEASVRGERLLIDSVRVSYDRTLAHLKKLGLIKGKFPKDLRPLSPYMGTLWRGYCYTLTEKGKVKADEILQEIMKPVSRLNQLINALEEL
jgi:hypothetical protein